MDETKQHDALRLDGKESTITQDTHKHYTVLNSMCLCIGNQSYFTSMMLSVGLCLFSYFKVFMYYVFAYTSRVPPQSLRLCIYICASSAAIILNNESYITEFIKLLTAKRP